MKTAAELRQEMLITFPKAKRYLSIIEKAIQAKAREGSYFLYTIDLPGKFWTTPSTERRIVIQSLKSLNYKVEESCKYEYYTKTKHPISYHTVSWSK